MDQRDDDVLEIARALGIEGQQENPERAFAQLELIKSIKKTIISGMHRYFECKKCGKHFKIPNAKDGIMYKCVVCNAVMFEIGKESVGTVDPKKVQLVLNESLPEEVQEAIKKPENVMGRYVLIQKIGEGGMGLVYRAYDVELSRYVAIKFIKSELADELKQEARTLAGLDHKNIAMVYDIGKVSGLGFIAVQLIRGETLRKAEQSLEKSLWLMTQICEAVDYAHRRGVIHRDIKPDNIMIDYDGTPFLMDFGIATRNLKEKEIVGTPGYMAPELATGEVSALGDIYSLAATLYFVLAGRPPAQYTTKDDPSKVLEEIKSNTITPIRQVLSDISPELESIIVKGLKADPAKRYQRPLEMAQDIRRYQMGYPVMAFSTSTTYRMKKAISRNGKIIAIAVCSLAAALAGLYFSWKKQTESQEQVEGKKLIEERTQKNQAEITRLLAAILADLSRAHEEALESRKSGESARYLNEIPKRILSSAVYKQGESLALNDPKVHHSIGRLYRLIGDVTSALECQDRALKLDPSYPPALYEIGVLQFNLYQRAMEKLREQWRRRCPDEADLPPDEQISNEQARNLKASAAKNLARAAKLLDSASIYRASTLAIFSCINGKTADAESKFLDILTRDKGFEDAVELLAQIYWLSGRWQKAVGVLTDAISSDKGNINFLMRRYYIYYSSGNSKTAAGKSPDADFTAAAGDLDAILKLDPENHAALAAKGKLMDNWGINKMNTGEDPEKEFQAGLECFDRCNARKSDTFVWRGKLFINFANYRISKGLDAEELYRRGESDFGNGIEIAAASGSDDVEAYLGRAALYMAWGAYLDRRGKDPSDAFSKSKKDFDFALGRDGTDFMAFMWRGMLWKFWFSHKEEHGVEADTEFECAIKDFDKSIEICERERRRNAEAWTQRGGAQVNMANYVVRRGKDATEYFSAAAESLQNAARQNPNNYETWLYTGNLWKNWGSYKQDKGENPEEDYSRAAAAYDKALGINPNHFDPWLFRAHIWLDIARLKESRGQNPEEHYKKALDDYNRALVLNPNNFDSWLGRGSMLFNWGLYRDGLRKNPTDLYDKSTEDLGHAAAMNPSIFDVWLRLGMLYVNRGVYTNRIGNDPSKEITRAIECFTKSIDINSGNYDIYLRRGGAHMNLGNQLGKAGEDPVPEYGLARADYDKAISLNPKDAVTWMRRGGLWGNWANHRRANSEDPMEEFKNALADFENAIRLNPRDHQIWVWRAMVHMNMSGYVFEHGGDPIPEYGAALNDFSQALTLNPNDIDALEMRSSIYRSRGITYCERSTFACAVNDFTCAIADCDRILKINPALKKQLTGFVDDLKARLADAKAKGDY